MAERGIFCFDKKLILNPLKIQLQLNHALKIAAQLEPLSAVTARVVYNFGPFRN